MVSNPPIVKEPVKTALSQQIPSFHPLAQSPPICVRAGVKKRKMLKSIVRDLIYLNTSEFNPISNNQRLLHLKVPAVGTTKTTCPNPGSSYPYSFPLPFA